MDKIVCEQYKILPLRREWNLWFDSPHLHETYESYSDIYLWAKNLNNVHMIDSVQTFWRIYNNIIEPAEMWYKSAYYLFSTSNDNHLNLSDPAWVTINFVIHVETDQNDAWSYVLVSILGEGVKHSNFIEGISFMKCKEHSELILWTKEHDDLTIGFLIEHFIKAFEKKGLSLLAILYNRNPQSAEV